MRLFALTSLVLLAACLRGQELPYHAAQPGYHDATVALAEYCLENALYSEARLLCKGLAAERAVEIIAETEGKTDEYTAQAWGGYLDRREAVQRRRAQGAEKDGRPANEIAALDPDHAAANEQLGRRHLAGLGWLKAAEHERLSPLVLKLADKPGKPPREATWEAPWVLVGARFTLVTDMPWSRALKYAGLLDRFHAVFFELVGDVIPARDAPNVVWCCKQAATFVEFSKSLGFPLTETHAGLHIGGLEAVLINAERCDFVGRKNKARDNLARTFYHECAHRLVESGLRGRRGGWASYELSRTTEHAWIVESIAIVFEDLNISGAKHSLKGLEDQRKYTIQTAWKGPKGKVPELQPVLAQGFSAFAAGTPISSAEKYALAGSVAWYCLFEKRDAYRKAYLSLLVDYYRLDTAGRDFKERFGVELADFETEWSPWVLKAN